ncbi:unnamed protein product [Chilo suppressalis]|uniref:FP protein C-terminal domain-containing protein n=1 Tax=Chilo suppressalis TaxID=168631 RepID=A0ABN8AQ56_CHISP|nr:unnamed protein product [Chilo suppressalis]
MNREADMSVCEGETTHDQTGTIDTTPPNYVFSRDRSYRSVTMSDFEVFKTEIKEMFHSLCTTQQQELKNICPTLQRIEQTNANIENLIALLTSQNIELSNRIVDLEYKYKENWEYITKLEDRIESLQMNCRKSNFEIKNLPKKNNETKEDLIDMVLSLSTTIGGNINTSDIKDIYRVYGRKTDKNATLVVELNSTMVKTNVLKLCKAFNSKTKSKLCAKHLGFRIQEDTPIFVSEQLTAKGSRLHFLARDLAKSKSYKYCWTAYGRVYVRKLDNSPIIAIKSEAQIQRLMQAE